MSYSSSNLFVVVMSLVNLIWSEKNILIEDVKSFRKTQTLSRELFGQKIRQEYEF